MLSCKKVKILFKKAQCVSNRCKDLFKQKNILGWVYFNDSNNKHKRVLEGLKRIFKAGELIKVVKHKVM